MTAFDALDAQMLVLGTPGSGKTTLLLELARSLIERCRSDDTLPLPIVLPLAPWAIRRPRTERLADRRAGAEIRRAATARRDVGRR